MTRTVKILAMFPNAGLIKMMMLTNRKKILIRTPSKILIVRRARRRILSRTPSLRMRSLLRSPSLSGRKALLLSIQMMMNFRPQGKLAMTREVLLGTLLGRLTLL